MSVLSPAPVPAGPGVRAAEERTPGRRVVPTGVRWVLALGLALTGAQLLRGMSVMPCADALGDLIHDLTCVLATAVVAWRVVARRADRAGWGCLAAGLALYSSGFLVFDLVVKPFALDRYPSPADPLWVALYPLTYLGLGLLLRARVRHWHRSLWLDGVVAALGLSAVAAEATDLLGIGKASGVLRNMSTVAYPTADLVLLVLVVASFAILGWRRTAPFALLGVALTAILAGDLAYLLDVDRGADAWSPTASGLWMLGMVLLAAAAWRDPLDGPNPPPHSWVLLLLPVVFTVLGALLLAYEALEDRTPDVSTLAMALASIVGASARTVLTYREVRALADVREQALTDDLTGLANRRHLDLELRTLQTAGAGFGVLLIDLDRFKEVNDSFGHGVGDELLVAVADRMTGEVEAAGGLLARMGGDEFGVVLPGADVAESSCVAARLHQVLVEVFAVADMELHVEASIGVAVSPDHGTDAGELLRRADMAMYVAKRAHLGSQLFERGTEDDALRRLQTLEELRAALRRDEVVAFYQPQLDLRTGRIAGVEALARWQHPDRGLLGPGAFIEVAEQAGLVGALFVRIARCSLRDARRWWDRGLALEVSVNVSANEVQDPSFPDTVAGLLAEVGLPGSVLKVEVTEGVLMLNPERGRDVIDRLRALGVRLSLDDFGTGYSSLSYLPSLPVQELKLDRSFISSLATDPRAAAVVRSTLDLAHQLGLESVAEGIEDPEALTLLADWGCDVAQGFYIAKPMSADHLERWLTESPWLTGDVPLPVAGATRPV